MNGVDFPVARVLDGIDAALDAGLTPIKINMVVRRGVNEASIVPMARWARDDGVMLRFIEYMDVGHRNGWRLDEVVPAAELIGGGSARAAAGAGRPGLPRRGRRALALPRRVGRGRGHRVGDPAVLSRLHAGAAVGRGQLYTCLFAVAGHDLRGLLRDGSDGRGARRVPRRDLAGPRRPLFRSAHRGPTTRPAEGRDVRDGRLTGRPGRDSTGAARVHSVIHIVAVFVDTLDGTVVKFVDNRVDRPPRRPVP